MENGDQPDITKLYSLLTEFVEEMNRQRNYSAQLHQQANGIKSQAIHSQTGFVLRRFNQDKPKEEYDAELERMNAAVAADNLALVHDNKQLNALIREYEATLETLMDQFRNRAYEVQMHELSLIHSGEEQVIAREDAGLDSALEVSNLTSSSLTRVSQLLRQTMRSLSGEDLESPPTSEAYAMYLQDTLPPGAETDVWDAVARADWALERECELTRLEDENRVLRRMLGERVEDADGRELFPSAPPGVIGPVREGERGMAGDDGRVSALPMQRPGRMAGQRLGGPKGKVGPFGSYKRMHGGWEGDMVH
ncbi:hypothetical protein K488DRAFT_47165 [Vararia minispora EC-137]|uniref:Uncharacterized protein n=1 Tax=Vararia minispora EC-137 TaxID=1314806 RepID=A0ACB8QPY1_9AGAM|nr:hypothetical protein K488DRAFT_47165 [Vararia minispora EC-137]